MRPFVALICVSFGLVLVQADPIPVYRYRGVPGCGNQTTITVTVTRSPELESTCPPCFDPASQKMPPQESSTLSSTLSCKNCTWPPSSTCDGDYWCLSSHSINRISATGITSISGNPPMNSLPSNSSTSSPASPITATPSQPTGTLSWSWSSYYPPSSYPTLGSTSNSTTKSKTSSNSSTHSSLSSTSSTSSNSRKSTSSRGKTGTPCLYPNTTMSSTTSDSSTSNLNTTTTSESSNSSFTSSESFSTAQTPSASFGYSGTPCYNSTSTPPPTTISSTTIILSTISTITVSSSTNSSTSETSTSSSSSSSSSTNSESNSTPSFSSASYTAPRSSTTTSNFTTSSTNTTSCGGTTITTQTITTINIENWTNSAIPTPPSSVLFPLPTVSSINTTAIQHDFDKLSQDQSMGNFTAMLQDAETLADDGATGIYDWLKSWFHSVGWPDMVAVAR